MDNMDDARDQMEDTENARCVRRRCEDYADPKQALTGAPESLGMRMCGGGSTSSEPTKHVLPVPTPCRAAPRQLDPASAEPLVMKQMPVYFRSSATEASPFRIVCYGDSLTAGYCNRGRTFEPYGRTLCKALSHVSIDSCIAVCGLSGKTAQQMADGLRHTSIRDYLEHEGQGLNCVVDACRPDLVIIMAGTNDLSRGHSPESILSCVQKLHSSCHGQKIPTVVLIPPVKARGSTRTMQQRLGGLLIDWSKTAPSVVGVFDVEKLAPRKPSGHFWDADEIHLSAAGQRTLGERLGERLACLPILAAFRNNTGHVSEDLSAGRGARSSATTLAGFFAANKAGAVKCNPVEGQRSVDQQFELAQAPGFSPSIASNPQLVGSTTVVRDGEYVRPSAPRGEVLSTEASRNVTASAVCKGLAGRAALAPVLRNLADKLVDALHDQTGPRNIAVGLNILGDQLGGWSGVLDIQIDLRGLQGDAIFEPLQTLANRASAALTLDTASARSKAPGDRCGWSGVDHVIARLRVQRV